MDLIRPRPKDLYHLERSLVYLCKLLFRTAVYLFLFHAGEVAEELKCSPCLEFLENEGDNTFASLPQLPLPVCVRLILDVCAERVQYVSVPFNLFV